MKIMFDIPDEFKRDYDSDRFKEFFERVLADMDHNLLCGKYEMETAKMFINAFSFSKEVSKEALISEISSQLKDLKHAICLCGTDLDYYQEGVSDADTVVTAILENTLNILDFSDIYGVEQSCHGHAYRFIYTGNKLKFYCGDSLPLKGENFCEDIKFPIGGSNSSATFITKLESMDEIKDFLLADYTTTYDDPQLVDIAEGLCTIETDNIYGSVTDEIVKVLHIPESELTKDNVLYKQAKRMIVDIKEKEQLLSDSNTGASKIDYSNPFYGSSRNMRFSELEHLHEEYLKK